ncbi:Uncharacterized protein DBV15_12730, partial [Temnothorax longispinosus]
IFNLYTDDFLILRFLRVCKFNLEKTKIRIKNHYKQRSDLPEWHMNKDPFLPKLQELLDMGFASMYKTINVIHRKHKMSSKRSEKAGVGGIYQRDMAITQFAFIGYVLIVPKSIGLCNNPQKEEALNHFWRVIGHILNLCRKTAAETRELCQKVSHILTEYLYNAPSEFYQMALAILDGLWYMDITLDKHAFLKFTYQLRGIECEYS